MYYTIRTNAKENRIAKAKAPPHPPLPPVQAGRKHRKTIQHGKIAWKFLRGREEGKEEEEEEEEEEEVTTGGLVAHTLPLPGTATIFCPRAALKNPLRAKSHTVCTRVCACARVRVRA